MPRFQSNLGILNRKKPLELVLNILSFAGGENTVGEDQELKSNEARVIKNWDAISLGGMKRSKGFTSVATDGAGAPAYTDDFDLLHHHYEGTDTEVYGIVNGDLVIKSGSDVNQEDASAFTAGTLSHAATAGDRLWITNVTDNIQYKEIGSSIATPTGVPSSAPDRIYLHKSRLVAEGSGTLVQGSRAGTANWHSSADTWTASNDAWSIDMPATTRGCVPGFPSGPEILVFTDFEAFALSNFPNVGFRSIQNSHGCAAPYSIVKGNEGVFFLSQYPTLGIYLYDGVNWVNLTENSDFIEDVNLSQRIFGTYRDNKYFFVYNESGSGVTYPNRMRIFDTKFGRWMERSVNDAVSDNFGYPTLLTRDNNELYFGSSQKSNIYELEDNSTSDNGEDTEATYRTKNFSSRDFSLASGGAFGIDNVRMKLIKFTIVYFGTSGNVSVQWSADNGTRSGSQTVGVTADGAKINEDFTVNTSNIITSPPDKTITKSFNNSAIGNQFNFEVINSDTGTRPEIKKLIIHSVALEES